MSHDQAICFVRHRPSLSIVLLFASGLTVGWFGRGLHDDDWRLSPPPAGWHLATLVKVVDGDTIKIKWDGTETSVRLLNINTPERGQPGYKEATEHLKTLIGPATAVMLQFEEDGVLARDQFGRLLCYVWLGDACLNVEQVRAGHSTYWTEYGEGRHAQAFRAAERQRSAVTVP